MVIRLQRTEENEEDDETAQEADQWVEDIYMCGLRIVNHHEKRGEGRPQVSTERASEGRR